MTVTPRVARFRRAAHLVTYWRDGRLLLHNYATGAQAYITPRVCEVLDRFDAWRDLDREIAGRSASDAAVFSAIVAALADGSFLERSDRGSGRAARGHESWAAWNPAAGLFHFSTKDATYTKDHAAAERRLRARARRDPMPSSVKSYRRAATIRLARGGFDGEFPRVLLERRTWRHFSGRPIELTALSALLELTFSVQRWGTVRGQGRVAFKTSPSGGARHPIEAYLLALNVRGLPRGLYHYAADRHALERLSTRATRAQLVRYCGDQRWYAAAQALVIMTAVFAREQWRYPAARAYRAVLLDAGHLCQTFCLTATWLGLAPFSTMALADSIVESDLGIDGVRESVVYAAGVGSRPAGGWSTTLQRAALRR